MLTVRPITTDADGRISREEYAVIARWWETRGGDAPTREMLGKMGVFADWNGKPAAVSFMYLDATGSGLAWLAWLAICPAFSGNRAARAVRAMVEFLSEQARALDYWTVCATYHHPALISLLKRQGFQKADTGMTHLFKKIA